MINRRILLLSTYPIKNPQHGGQKRTNAIYNAYKHKFSEVRHSAVFYGPFYVDRDADDIPLSKESEQLVMSSPLTGDIVCGHAIYNDSVVKRKMTALLLGLKPDIIHIEQPFPYLGLKPLLAELQMNPKIVFGSQNIEAFMKREILEGVNVAESFIAETEATIDSLEHELSTVSDLVVACTKSDMMIHEKMGAKKTVLAQNGVAAAQATPQARAYWQEKFQKLGVTKTAAFVGSAHPPNWTGFLDMVGKGLGFVPYDGRIVAAGSISDYFEREIKPDALNIEDATFWLRGFSTGRLSEEKLVGLIANSDVILLPITEGGGSNLKTAEAILADKKVVATKHALRSFEWFKDFPNVWMADTKSGFQKSIVEAFEAPFITRSKEQVELAQQVEWRNCLAAMIEEVGAL